jgi:Flp pilus assembly pilin Flp
MSQLNRACRQIVSTLVSPRGQTMTEYAMILATIALVLISLFNSAGTIVSMLVSRVDPML